MDAKVKPNDSSRLCLLGVDERHKNTFYVCKVDHYATLFR